MRHPATIKTNSNHVGALRGLLNREIGQVRNRITVMGDTMTAEHRASADEYLDQLRGLLEAVEAAG